MEKDGKGMKELIYWISVCLCCARLDLMSSVLAGSSWLRTWAPRPMPAKQTAAAQE